MPDAKTIIRAFHTEDFSFIKEIYQQGIDTGNATFETTAPEWAVLL